jgi:hypothetical protein
MRMSSKSEQRVECDYRLSDSCEGSTTIDLSGIRRGRRSYIRDQLGERGWDRSTLGDVCPNCKELLEQHDL